MRGYFRKNILNTDKNLQSYIIGLAIGDGNLSSPNGKIQRLRITCDKKYPLLINKIAKSLQVLLPENKVSLVDRNNNCIDVSVYSNHLEKLLGWKCNKGSKYKQKVSIPLWIKEQNNYTINCLRGLIETDGSIYSDRGYDTVMFTTIIPKLAKDAHETINSLGFKSRIYKIKKSINSKYYFKQKAIYRIRLCKDVSRFLDLIKPEKK